MIGNREPVLHELRLFRLIVCSYAIIDATITTRRTCASRYAYDLLGVPRDRHFQPFPAVTTYG